MAIRLVMVMFAVVLVTGACNRALPDLGDGVVLVADDAADDAIAPSPTLTLSRYERIVHVVTGDPPLVSGRVHVPSLFRPPRALAAR